MPAITVENLSKEYMIGGRMQADTLREQVASIFRSSALRVREKGKPRQERFWALKDVGFEVAPGEVVGIIGRNGAGKSTLLKILSRITEPTTGRAELYGRVSSLLEVGTGFHPELSGRENVFLNGSILGMSRAGIRKKFDEIVAFAEVERFLDTPVKHYSSGMYMRLAFAVAAHLDSEILVIDEVLAVGDLSFQKKCLGKMDEIRHQGRTLLIVSHNMTTILGLCTKCLLLDGGEIKSEGAPGEVVAQYQEPSSPAIFGRMDLGSAEHGGNGKARFLTISIRPLGPEGEPLPVPQTGCNLKFELGIRAFESIRMVTVALVIYDDAGARLIDANTLVKGDGLTLEAGRSATVTFRLHEVRLRRDLYTVGLWMGVLNDSDVDVVRFATSFRMEARMEDIRYTTPFPGTYACDFRHSIRTE